MAENSDIFKGFLFVHVVAQWHFGEVLLQKPQPPEIDQTLALPSDFLAVSGGEQTETGEKEKFVTSGEQRRFDAKRENQISFGFKKF